MLAIFLSGMYDHFYVPSIQERVHRQTNKVKQTLLLFRL